MVWGVGLVWGLRFWQLLEMGTMENTTFCASFMGLNEKFISPWREDAQLGAGNPFPSASANTTSEACTSTYVL